MKRHYRTIYTYLTKEIISTFIVSFAFFFFIFFVNQILLLAEKIFAAHVPIVDVLNLLVYYLPQIITIAFPFSTLVAALMAVGRLSADNEILALRASGVSLLRVFSPLLMLSVLFTGIAFLINDYYVPLSIIKTNIYYKEIMTKNPGLEFESYTVKKFNNILITNGSVEGNKISDIVIIDRTTNNEKRIISARDALLLQNKNQEGVISLELRDVFSHVADNNEKGNYEYSRAEKMIYNILFGDVVGGNLQTDAGPRGMSSVDLYKVIKDKTAVLNEKKKQQEDKVALASYELAMQLDYAYALAADKPGKVMERIDDIRRVYENLRKEKTVTNQDRTLRIYLMEFHRKFAHPFSCLVFAVFAFPVGLFARRSGRAVGFAIGVIMSGFYWVTLFVFYRLGAQVEYSSFLMMWMPNFIILAAGLAFFYMRLKE